MLHAITFTDVIPSGIENGMYYLYFPGGETEARTDEVARPSEQDAAVSLNPGWLSADPDEQGSGSSSRGRTLKGSEASRPVFELPLAPGLADGAEGPR